MNISIFETGSQFDSSNGSKTIFAGNLMRPMGSNLKSSQEKAERQQKAASQIAFFEGQKESLKNMQCETLEEIARKLEMFHTYENEIAAVKMNYNHEQMMHALDEAKEMGEKIAKAAEKLEPKTAEERRKEMAEEALGTDESKGLLDELLEETEENLLEVMEEIEEEALEEQEEAEEIENLEPGSMSLETEQFNSKYLEQKHFDALA